MNYLDLCKRVSQEAGYSGSGPSKVTGQTGEMQRVVSWVQDAWIELQQQQKYWRFMLSSFDVTMNQGESSVTVAADYKRTKKDSVVVTRANGSKVYPTELAPEECDSC